jgi:hypothetical protein
VSVRHDFHQRDARAVCQYSSFLLISNSYVINSNVAVVMFLVGADALPQFTYGKDLSTVGTIATAGWHFRRAYCKVGCRKLWLKGSKVKSPEFD